MISPEFVTEPQVKVRDANGDTSTNTTHVWQKLEYPLYFLALAIAIATWFLAVRAPLTDDETGSFWLISQGFTKISARADGLFFPVYPYILWFFTKILGTSETALRIPSILAISGAVYFLYRSARELFDSGIAFLVTIIFCVHPVVLFASIDVRPYAFASLAINASIFVLLRTRNNDSYKLAGLFGLLAACIVYFHFLFVVILPSLVICFFLVNGSCRKVMCRRFVLAVATFLLALLPTITGLRYTFNTRLSHVYDLAPSWLQLAGTLAPGWLLPIALVIALLAAVTRRLDFQKQSQTWRVCFCLALGLIPILVLYTVSTDTPIHVFLPRYHVAAVSGIALCWGLIASCFDSRGLRLAFCLAVVATSTAHYARSPEAKHHLYSWKYALEATEKNSWFDNAPILICSEFVESRYLPMPLDSAKESQLFAQLSYYKLTAPVVPLPQTLNQETIGVVSGFLKRPETRRQRFLAMAYEASYRSLNWIIDSASATHSARVIGVFDGVAVVEFTPLQD